MHGVTAAHSPFSNGLCEKNHAVVDQMMSKLMADDNHLKEDEALNHALFAKNVEPNNKGFSSLQIVYGNNPTIPGILTSTPPSLSTNFTSKHVREHLANINKAREAFRIADNDERIKRALKSRIQSYINEKYSSDDKVYFKQKDKVEWSGPATVIGQQGKVVFLKYGNNLRRVHMSRVIRVGEEFKQSKEEEKNEETAVKLPTEIAEPEKENEVAELATSRPKRRVAIRRPEKSRRILYSNEDNEWKHAHVKDVGKSSGSDQFKCTLILDNKDEMLVDFSDKNITWKYEIFSCDKCDQTFESSRGLRMHISKVHKVKNRVLPKTVSFNTTEEVNYNENETNDVKRVKMRFKEILKLKKPIMQKLRKSRKTLIKIKKPKKRNLKTLMIMRLMKRLIIGAKKS